MQLDYVVVLYCHNYQSLLQLITLHIINVLIYILSIRLDILAIRLVDIYIFAVRLVDKRGPKPPLWWSEDVNNLPITLVLHDTRQTIIMWNAKGHVH